jgi:hypothetical protein
MKRIVYTLALGKPKFAECAIGLARSLKLIGDTTERVLVTDLEGQPWGRYFDRVLPYHPIPTQIAEKFPDRQLAHPLEWIFFNKLTALERTDADQVLFIDADSLAFRRLDPIFDYCQGRGLTVSGRWVTEGSWYGDVGEHCRRHGILALGQFNGGLIYYERTPECQEFISEVMDYGARAAELGFQRDDPLIPDEPCIALAMAQRRCGHLAPDEADWSNTAVGLVGQLKLDVLRNECAYVCRRYQARFVRPYIFHAARYISFRIYWRQLAALESLERFELRRGFGYMSPAHKLRRSIERRYLKLVGRNL